MQRDLYGITQISMALPPFMSAITGNMEMFKYIVIEGMVTATWPVQAHLA